MATSGDPKKRPPPLALAMASGNEAGYRRHQRSATLMSPVSGGGEAAGHRRRLSEGVGRLFKSAGGSPQKRSFGSRHGKDFSNAPIPSVLGLVEQRQEARAGKIPPSGDVHSHVVIETVDLRQQCRESARERDSGRQKALRSLTTSTKNLLASATNTTRKTFKKESVPSMPSMPSKAAETMGYAHRAQNRQKTIKIKPSGLPKLPSEYSPSRESQSSRAPLLPAKTGSGEIIYRSHYEGAGLRDRSRWSSDSSLASRRSPKKSFGTIKIDTKGKGRALTSPRPPTPPAKDTPPQYKYADSPTSPLRRMSQSRDLRSSFDLPKPVFNQPFKFPRHSGIARPVQQPGIARLAQHYTTEEVEEPQGVFNAEAMTNLIFSRPHPDDDDDGDDEQVRGDEEVHHDEQGHEEDQVHDAEQVYEDEEVDGEEQVQDDEQVRGRSSLSRDSLQLLRPRFYSPHGHSAGGFAQGETPSTNSDTRRFHLNIPSRTSPPTRSQESSDSKEGSIGVMFQGNPEDIDRGSSTFQMLSERDKAQVAARDNTVITTRVMQELRLSDNDQTNSATSSQPVSDRHPSRLTAMLHEADTRAPGWQRDFVPNCPSAIPSPLHQMPLPVTPGPSTMATPNAAPLNIHTPRNLDEHFWMTNEHLDVVGKTTWDILEMSNRDTLAVINSKHAKLVAHMDKHFEDLKSHLTTVDEKADRSAEKVANIHQDVDKLMSVFNTEIASAFAAQENKTAQIEGQLKDLQNSMQVMQKLLEQKNNEVKSGQQLSANNTPHSPYGQQNQRSQPPQGGYYGHHTNPTRDGQPPMPQLHDNMSAASSYDASGAAQTGNDSGYGNQWGSRYPARGSSREARTPYSSTNPYLYASGGPFNGGYPGGYSHNFPSSPNDAQSGFGPGQAK